MWKKVLVDLLEGPYSGCGGRTALCEHLRISHTSLYNYSRGLSSPRSRTQEFMVELLQKPRPWHPAFIPTPRLEIYQLLDQGFSQSEVGRKLERTRQRINQIAKERKSGKV